MVSGRRASLGGRPTVATLRTGLAKVIRELIDDDLRV